MARVVLDVITAGEGQSVLVSIIDDVQSVQVQKKIIIHYILNHRIRDYFISKSEFKHPMFLLTWQRSRCRIIEDVHTRQTRFI